MMGITGLTRLCDEPERKRERPNCLMQEAEKRTLAFDSCQSAAYEDSCQKVCVRGLMRLRSDRERLYGVFELAVDIYQKMFKHINKEGNSTFK